MHERSSYQPGRAGRRYQAGVSKIIARSVPGWVRLGREPDRELPSGFGRP
jgi:hypothetical protein